MHVYVLPKMSRPISQKIRFYSLSNCGKVLMHGVYFFLSKNKNTNFNVNLFCIPCIFPLTNIGHVTLDTLYIFI